MNELCRNCMFSTTLSYEFCYMVMDPPKLSINFECKYHMRITPSILDILSKDDNMSKIFINPII